MRTILLAVAFLCAASCLLGATIVEAPVTIKATVTTMNTPSYTSKGVTLKESVIKITNSDILKECVRRGIISSTSGWKIVCYYDAEMDGVFVGSHPSFRLRHKSGRTASLDAVMSLSLLANTANGKATFSGSKVSGNMNVRAIYYLAIAYRGYIGECAGAFPIKLTVSGKKTKYIGIAKPLSVTFDGYVAGEFYSVVQTKISIGTFKKR